ncbi:unnamed protein product [Arabidopsis thaliana]|uniref:(thale cress) hypothetical protein n=1 Tax=Arabidopsis thaliana TaxID=3702 RepID=A0A7G2E394_ARATH|nr:unnamed protein product [Arabidopsis thaliana]
MRPETLAVIQKQLTKIKAAQRNMTDNEVLRSMDEFMFCFENCYTEDETFTHIAHMFPSYVLKIVKSFFQISKAVTDEESREAYLTDAEECASVRRSQARDTSEEAKRSQGEASTSQKCEPNCNKH